METVKNVLPQYCNRKRVSELLQEYITNNGKNYDLVILHRLDIQGSEIDFKNMEKNDNVVYIPDGSDYGGYNDRVLISTPNGVKLACSLYDNVIQYLEDRCAYHPETLHKWHLDKCGFTVRRFQYNTEIRR